MAQKKPKVPTAKNGKGRPAPKANANKTGVMNQNTGKGGRAKQGRSY